MANARSCAVVEGQQFSAWTVLSVLYRAHGAMPRARCRCSCGVERNVVIYTLLSGASRGCGCAAASRTKARFTTHGGSQTAEFRTWAAMIGRCHNPRNGKYPIYGGRGIAVCLEWRDDFAAFREHIGPKPSPKHSIDRIDNNKNYEPGNVRWATNKEQSRNRRSNVWVELDGERITVTEYCDRTGVKWATVKSRLYHGIPLSSAILPGRICYAEYR